MNFDYFYYQIDYIDKDGLANYIETFEQNKLKSAKRHLEILNQANQYLNDDTKFVLDKYGVIEDSDDDDILIKENITNVDTIKEHIAKVKGVINESKQKFHIGRVDL